MGVSVSTHDFCRLLLRVSMDASIRTDNSRPRMLADLPETLPQYSPELGVIRSRVPCPVIDRSVNPDPSQWSHQKILVHEEHGLEMDNQPNIGADLKLNDSQSRPCTF